MSGGPENSEEKPLPGAMGRSMRTCGSRETEDGHACREPVNAGTKRCAAGHRPVLGGGPSTITHQEPVVITSIDFEDIAVGQRPSLHARRLRVLYSQGDMTPVPSPQGPNCRSSCAVGDQRTSAAGCDDIDALIAFFSTPREKPAAPVREAASRVWGTTPSLLPSRKAVS